MTTRRKFIAQSTIAAGLLPFLANAAFAKNPKKTFPVVISTWDAGLAANQRAWEYLSNNKSALDAVEYGVIGTESEMNCCVGLNGNPDREGIVTLDAAIMNHLGDCGSVAALERIEHPISVARAVMEKSPHVFLVGEGAQQFAVANGFKLMPQKLSADAEKAYKNWLEKSAYHPIINIENLGNRKSEEIKKDLKDDKLNHDTIAQIAMDNFQNLSGSCTTSGMAFKYRGRLGDSSIIGSGLFVDNEVGAAAATGHGEEIIRIVGSHLIVELMRQGKSPKAACKAAVERAIKLRGKKLDDKQIAFIAMNKHGEADGYALQKGFTFAVCSAERKNEVFKADSYF